MCSACVRDRGCVFVNVIERERERVRAIERVSERKKKRDRERGVTLFSVLLLFNEMSFVRKCRDWTEP